MHNAFVEVKVRFGPTAEVVLWGKTFHPQFEVAVVFFPPAGRTISNPYVAFCFDTLDGGFYHPDHCMTMEHAEAAFLAKLDAYGRCSSP